MNPTPPPPPTLEVIGDVFGGIGDIASGAAGIIHNEAYWIGAQGQFYTRGLRSQRGGWANSFKVAGKHLARLRSLGNKAGYLGMALTAANMYNTGQVMPSDILQAGLAGGALAFPGVGAIVAVGYFAADVGFEYCSGTSLSDRMDAAWGPALEF